VYCTINIYPPTPRTTPSHVSYMRVILIVLVGIIPVLMYKLLYGCTVISLLGSCDTIYPHVSPHIFRWHIPCYVCACVPYIHWLPLLFVCNSVVFLPIVSYAGIVLALLS